MGRGIIITVLGVSLITAFLILKLNANSKEGENEPLTPRERQVLSLLAKGYSTKEIAQLLSISPHTTRNHIQSILQKLGVHSRLEAVLRAIEYRLIKQ